MNQFIKASAFIFILLISFSIQAQTINIPDRNFKEALITLGVDANNDGEIQESEALAVTSLYLNIGNYGLWIESLEGIEYFKNLDTLSCRSNQLTSLNTNNLEKLKFLDCSDNKLKTLNVSSSNQLMYLDCSTNYLDELDVTKLDKIVDLKLNYNQIKELNLKNNHQLIYLECYENIIKDLDVSNLSQLQRLFCSKNLLTNLVLHNLTQLTELSCIYNQLTELDLSNLSELYFLRCENNLLKNIILGNINKITYFSCSYNQLTSLDVSNLSQLESLFCYDNQLSEINLGEINQLKYLGCISNQLTNLDLSNLYNLELLRCYDNQITTLQINSLNPKLSIYCYANPMETIFLKNGINNDVYYNYFLFDSLSSIKYICADASEVEDLKIKALKSGLENIIINSFCNPAGDFHTLIGNIKVDIDNDGCDQSDLSYPNIKIKISNTIETGFIITDTDGNFSTDLNAGTYTFQPVIEHPNYFSVNPSFAVITLLDTISPAFCITPNGVHNDLSISVIPTSAARPGFSDAKYKVVYKNQGTTTQSGTVAFNYEGTKMNFISSTPIADNTGAGNVSFDFSNLAPFETRSALITIRTNAPTDNPAINSGDVLEFTATIIGATDETPDDNLATLNQTVVGSFDPNDKTCLEGEVVSPELIGKNVHYLIRFENTGTANAENIVVTDFIDTTVFEISTLQITDASHTCHTQISQGNKVQFIFSDIQLPFTEPDKHGYVAFSIKLKEDLVIGDSIKNKADIFFDYNLPVETNIAAAEINYKTITYIGKNQTLQGALDIYPNPSNGQFALELKANIKAPVQISILNVEGKTVFAKSLNHQNQSNLSLDLKHLAKGVYLVKAQIENDVFSKKVVIQ